MKKFYFLVFFLLLSTSFIGIFGQQKLPPANELPLRIKPSEFVPIWDLQDDELQRILERRINSNPKWKDLAERKKLAVGLVDLRDTADIEFAGINPNVMMYAASLPKIAILFAAMDAFEKGDLEEKVEYRNDLRLMIARSDNAASTRMIDRLGYNRINNLLMDPKYELYSREHGGGLWVGKRYAKTGERKPEPMKGISHAATAAQVSRYYYMMVFGQLVNYNRSKQMMDILVAPELHHKFVNTIDKLAPNADVYRKSGTWQAYHADSMLVWGPTWRKYILVALIEDPDGEAICRQLVTTAEEVLRERRRIVSE